MRKSYLFRDILLFSNLIKIWILLTVTQVTPENSVWSKFKFSLQEHWSHHQKIKFVALKYTFLRTVWPWIQTPSITSGSSHLSPFSKTSLPLTHLIYYKGNKRWLVFTLHEKNQSINNKRNEVSPNDYIVSYCSRQNFMLDDFN